MTPQLQPWVRGSTAKWAGAGRASSQSHSSVDPNGCFSSSPGPSSLPQAGEGDDPRTDNYSFTVVLISITLGVYEALTPDLTQWIHTAHTQNRFYHLIHFVRNTKTSKGNKELLGIFSCYLALGRARKALVQKNQSQDLEKNDTETKEKKGGA